LPRASPRHPCLQSYACPWRVDARSSPSHRERTSPGTWAHRGQGHPSQDAAAQALHQLHDVLAKHERHSQVDLAELGLVEPPAGLIVGTAADLPCSRRTRSTIKICLKSCGLCGQAYQEPGRPVGRETRGPLGRGLIEDGRLDLEEPFFIEDASGDCITRWRRPRMCWHLRRRRIYVAVREADLLVGEFREVIGQERRVGRLERTCNSLTTISPGPYSSLGWPRRSSCERTGPPVTAMTSSLRACRPHPSFLARRRPRDQRRGS